MSSFQWALLFHLAGAILFFSGMAVAGVASVAARRRERASEIALLLRLTRSGVLLVGIGTVLLLAFGFWLVELTPGEFADGWLSAAFALFLVAAVAGALGGQRPKRARLRAEELAAADARPDPELRRLLDDRLSLALNYVSLVLAVAVLVLMVWRPGS